MVYQSYKSIKGRPEAWGKRWGTRALKEGQGPEGERGRTRPNTKCNLRLSVFVLAMWVV
jgi:hypothetical protein